jgi:hypothetical protein
VAATGDTGTLETSLGDIGENIKANLHSRCGFASNQLQRLPHLIQSSLVAKVKANSSSLIDDLVVEGSL